MRRSISRSLKLDQPVGLIHDRAVVDSVVRGPPLFLLEDEDPVRIRVRPELGIPVLEPGYEAVPHAAGPEATRPWIWNKQGRF